jgi:glutamyl-tRNA reductase
MGAEELFFLETCNRREFLIKTCHPLEPASAKAAWVAGLQAELGCPLDQDDFFLLQGESALLHLFRVASSLESMVLGETEIIRQIRDQAAEARIQGLLGPYLTLWIDFALRASKRVRTETTITRNPTTYASLAFRHACGDSAKRRVAFLGSGSFMRSILPYFDKGELLEKTFISRNIPSELATLHRGKAMSLQEFLASPPPFDALVAATACPEQLISAHWVQSLAFRPNVFIDLALPANLDPALAELPGVSLFHLQGFDRELAANRLAREAELPKAEPVFQELLQELKEKCFEQSLAGFHREMSQYFETMGKRALDHYLRQHGACLEEDQVACLRDWTSSLVSRLLPVPVLGLKGVARAMGDEGIRAYTAEVRASTKLFQDSLQ